MNEEICCITNEGKTAKDEWENDYSDFLRALYSVYKKIRTILFPYFTCYNLSVGSYKYFEKLISKVKKHGLGFLKILCTCA